MKPFLLLLFFFWGCRSQPEADTLNPAEATLKGKVIKIIDGDTFDLLTKDKRTIRIRMYGIDCPERRQDYYQVAKDGLANFIFEKEVAVQEMDKDRYQRIVGDVYYGGTYINAKMVEQGFAWHYKQYSKDQRLADAEVAARKARRGLWEPGNAIAPWDYRKKKKEKASARKGAKNYTFVPTPASRFAASFSVSSFLAKQNRITLFSVPSL